jgi:flavin reductase (DIM6/NTAB) family NADH-FMN oxidoreductase RutF/rubredoxin
MKKWRCTVCGYEHEGDEPPLECPICGVGPNDFVLLQEESTLNSVKSESKKSWKCTVCDYIHEGDQPPDSCPLCGVGPELFVLLEQKTGELTAEKVANTDAGTIRAALETVSYGLYIVTAMKDNMINGQCANSVIQLTTSPPRVAICLNKNNLTHEFIEYSKTFAISVLGREHVSMVRNFGYRSGRNADKFTDIKYIPAQNGCPIMTDSIAYFEGRILPEKTTDVGTHTLFVADVTAGQLIANEEALTYAFFRNLKKK